jgi:hypothetical protein
MQIISFSLHIRRGKPGIDKISIRIDEGQSELTDQKLYNNKLYVEFSQTKTYIGIDKCIMHRPPSVPLPLVY